MADFAWTDYETSHRDVERRREREARFLPQKFQPWEYFTPEGDDDAGTDLREMPDDHAMRTE